MNCVALTGRLTRDPELRQLPSGDSVCSMRLAVDRMGRGDEAGYIDIATFGKQAEACAQVLAEGWKVAVDGRLDFREWLLDGSETRRSALQVVGHVEFLAAPRDTAESRDETETPVGVGAQDTDDIPF